MPWSGMHDAGIYDAKEMAEMRRAIEAVCAELGIDRTDEMNRERVANRVIRSWAMGQRTPLGLVNAGLEG